MNDETKQFIKKIEEFLEKKWLEETYSLANVFHLQSCAAQISYVSGAKNLIHEIGIFIKSEKEKEETE